MGVFTTFRRNLLTAPIFRWAQKALPAMSATESDAIEAGDTWWDSALFSGHPDWQKLLDTPPAVLTAAEQAFLDGPVVEVCRMVDDWRVNFTDHDLPP
ncbi:MAG: acyl-CoA dehydrogenase, partial [Rhodospirillaceae bacterium]|nr:acyl-CoA dehydrogenase [Rhodospirillaceae bacterium]